MVGTRLSVIGRANRGSTVGLLLLQCFSVCLAVEYSSCIIPVLNLIYMFAVLMHPGDHLLGKSCRLGFLLVLFFSLCRLYCMCSFPIWCLGEDTELDITGA